MFLSVRPTGAKGAEETRMQIEPNTATAIALIVLGLWLAVVLLGMLTGALGYLGGIGQFLAVSWLIGSALLVATTFLEIHQGSSLDSPN